MDAPFTIDNPGYWLKPSRWPRWSAEDEFLRLDWRAGAFEENGEPRVEWKPTWIFLLSAVHQIGTKMWGDRWRRPPFRMDLPDRPAALDRFMRTIVRIRALCDSGRLRTYYEVLESDGPDGSYDPDRDDLRGIMHGILHDDWYAPGWERFFLLGTVRTGNWESWIYVHRLDLEICVAMLQPQPDEPVPAIEAKGAEEAPLLESSRARRLSSKTAPEFVSNYLKDAANPSISDLEDAAKAAGIVGGRDLLRPEYRRQMELRTGQPAKQGRRPNLPKQSAEK